MNSSLFALVAGKKKTYDLLRSIQNHQPVYIEELVHLGWTRGTATSLLKELEGNKLVAFRHEFRGNKGAVKRYHLTEKGKQFLANLEAAERLLEE